MKEKKAYEAPAFQVVHLVIKAQILGLCQLSTGGTEQAAPKVCGNVGKCQYP